MAIIRKTETKKELKYEVVEKLGILGQRKGGKETIELRYVAWNGNDPKYEIRTWYTNEDGTEGCGKGISMSGEELLALKNILMEAEAE